MQSAVIMLRYALKERKPDLPHTAS